jgi:rubredoxin-NAD+ reductase
LIVIKGVTVKIWQCLVCGLIYEETKGWPDDGIAAGTRWEDVPADWACPECGASKAEFEMVEF